MKNFSSLRVAIVHDSIRYFGGAERVLVALKNTFPQADIYTSIVYWEGMGVFGDTVKELSPHTSWAQRVPLFRRYPFLFRYLLPTVWKSFDFSTYDLVISSSGAQMSHLIHVRPPAIHMCYCHTPPRHLYGYITDTPWDKNIFVSYFSRIGNYFLRKADLAASKQVFLYIANSVEVVRRIHTYYGREAEVIYPPVSLYPKQKSDKKKRANFFLVVSRLSRMKHVDLVIQSCIALKQTLIIVGLGPEEEALKRMSDKRYITFLGQVSDGDLSHLYASCRAVVCAAEDEDFGIVPVEAMSHGKPVIAYYSGGYKETVIEGKTGILFSNLTVNDLIRAIHKFESTKFNFQCIKKFAQYFSVHRFTAQINRIIKLSL
jgi:glycosyltransferase involved in cell wall biosynthesis